MTNPLSTIINQAIDNRRDLIHPPYETAFRLLNGFSEHVPGIVADVFGKTLVLNDYRPISHDEDATVNTLIHTIQDKLPWLTTGILKRRRSKRANERNGMIIVGSSPDTTITENGITYAIDLTMNQDSSFYLDTRHLRKWLHDNLKGKTLLNTFAYTGSLGIAAEVGGATVIQLDLSHMFLTVAKRSAKLNHTPINTSHYQVADFWSRVHHYKQHNMQFDCVILDPPIYSKTSKGTIDLAKNYKKLINKVRPIIAHNGYLITINNALFQSGQDHQNELLDLCKDGYLSIEKIIDVPSDCVGYSTSLFEGLPTSPSPYNHSTKITILNVTKKEPSTTYL